MNIGQLKLNAAGVYVGKIQTATLDLAVGLRPVQSSNAAAPKYDVMVRARNGQFLPVGGLWEKASSKDGVIFLQGQIDDPSFDAPLSIALFTQEDGVLNVAWSRPRRRAASAFGDSGMIGAANDGDDAARPAYGAASPFGDLEPGMAIAA